MNAAIITTTINVPYNLRDWARFTDVDDVIIIAGDHKSPHDEIENLCKELEHNHGITVVYLSPKKQLRWHSSDAIGWNKIQRRNIALLESLTYNPDFIVTIDDDNFPESETQMLDYKRALFDKHENSLVITSSNGWFNIGDAYYPPIIHRGYPLDQRHARPDLGTHLSRDNIGVVASLWIGDPDIDAIERIHRNPTVSEPSGLSNIVTAKGTWCPFNSQATAFRRELAPLMMMWPGVGRFDDIWASYVTRAVMDHIGLHVSYGRPFVRQERNEHNLLNDLRNEMYGYEHTPRLCEFLRSISFRKPINGRHNVIDLAHQVYAELRTLDFISASTHNAFTAWMEDILHLCELPTNAQFMLKDMNNDK